ncbi:MAG: TIR domain-containing protein [Vicinamibacterales bacterium]
MVAFSCPACGAIVRGAVELRALAAGADGTRLTYAWSADGGVLSASDSPTVVWTPTMTGTFNVSVTVRDQQGGSTTSTQAITAVLAPRSERRAQPAATASPIAPIGERPGTAPDVTPPTGTPTGPVGSPGPPGPTGSTGLPGGAPSEGPVTPPGPPPGGLAADALSFQWALLFIGLLLVLVIVGAAFAVPEPTSFQLLVFRTTLALGAATFVVAIPGFVGASSNVMSAGSVTSGLGVFLLVYGYNPLGRLRAEASGPAPPPAPQPLAAFTATPPAPAPPGAAGGASPGAASIFISYRRHETTAVVGRLDEHLRARFGDHAVFKDANDIMPGRRFKDVITEALQKCRVVIAVIGPDWETMHDEHDRRKLDDPRDFVVLEIGTALMRQLPVVPLLVDRDTLPAADLLPAAIADLRDYQALPLRPDPDFDRDVDRLIEAIETLMASPPAAT